jgi:hypothetical protein
MHGFDDSAATIRCSAKHSREHWGYAKTPPVTRDLPWILHGDRRRDAGGAIGVALLGTLLARGSFVSGLHAAMGVSAAAFAAAALVTAVAVGGASDEPCVIMDTDECDRRPWLGSGERRRRGFDARDTGQRGQAAAAPDGS